MIWGFVCLFGIINAIRGAGGNKFHASISFGILSSCFLSYYSEASLFTIISIGLAVSLGFRVALLAARGGYYSAYHGRDPILGNSKGEWWINEICSHFFPPTNKVSQSNRLYGLLGMSICGLYYYATFIALAMLTPWALLIGLGMILLGPIFYSAGILPEAHSQRFAEVLEACLFAVLIALTVVVSL